MRRVPARFDRRSLLLWILAAVVAGGFALWDLASRDGESPSRGGEAPSSQQAPDSVQPVEIVEDASRERPNASSASDAGR